MQRSVHGLAGESSADCSVIQTPGRGRSRFLELVFKSVHGCDPVGRQRQQSHSCNHPSMDGAAVLNVDLTQCHPNTGKGPKCPVSSASNPPMDVILKACRDNRGAGLNATVHSWMLQAKPLLTSLGVVQTLEQVQKSLLSPVSKSIHGLCF